MGACHVTIIVGMVYKRSIIFEAFWEYLGKFLIFFRKIFFVAKSYLVVVININILIMDALVTLETSLKVPILAVFYDFWHKHLAFTMIFPQKKLFNVCTFTCSKGSFNNYITHNYKILTYLPIFVTLFYDKISFYK